MHRFCQDPGRLHQCGYKGTGFVQTFNASTASRKDAFAVLDLNLVNDASVVQSWQRGFATLGGKSGLLIVDEYVGGNVSNVTWALHTHASVKVLPPSSDGKGFQLDSAGAEAGNRVVVQVLEPADAVLESFALHYNNDKNYPDPGLTKLMVTAARSDAQHVSTAASLAETRALDSPARIIVQISREADAKIDADKVQALHAWKVAGPLL